MYNDKNQKCGITHPLLKNCYFIYKGNGMIFFAKECMHIYILVTVTSSGILKAKQKLGRTFNSDKLGGIDFTKISKLTMCSA